MLDGHSIGGYARKAEQPTDEVPTMPDDVLTDLREVLLAWRTVADTASHLFNQTGDGRQGRTAAQMALQDPAYRRAIQVAHAVDLMTAAA